MAKLNGLLVFLCVIAVGNEVFAGEKIPSPQGMWELTGSDKVTGAFALAAVILAVFMTISALMFTLRYFQERSEKAKEADHKSVSFTDGEEASFLYMPTVQMIFGILLTMIGTWGPSFLGYFVGYIYRSKISFAITSIL